MQQNASPQTGGILPCRRETCCAVHNDREGLPDLLCRLVGYLFFPKRSAGTVPHTATAITIAEIAAMAVRLLSELAGSVG